MDLDEVEYEGFISFLQMRLDHGAVLVLVRDWMGRLYAKETSPNGMVHRWFYVREADAQAIADHLDIPYEDRAGGRR